MPKMYPWDKWFSSKHFTLHENVDYKCLTFTMNSQIRNMAVKRGIKISVHHSRDDKGDVITVTVKS